MKTTLLLGKARKALHAAQAQTLVDEKAARIAKETAQAAKIKLKYARKIAKLARRAARNARQKVAESLETLNRTRKKLKKLEKRAARKNKSRKKPRSKSRGKRPAKKPIAPASSTRISKRRNHRAPRTEKLAAHRRSAPGPDARPPGIPGIPESVPASGAGEGSSTPLPAGGGQSPVEAAGPGDKGSGNLFS